MRVVRLCSSSMKSGGLGGASVDWRRESIVTPGESSPVQPGWNEQLGELGQRLPFSKRIFDPFALDAAERGGG
jgi:hypothetical protein